MSELKRALTGALKEAMKAKDRERRDALRLLQSAIKQAEVDQRVDLDDDAIVSILRREAKKRREAIDELDEAGRLVECERERFELAVTEEFLPRQMTSEELKPLAQAVIAEVGASSMKEMGSVMRALMPKVQGRADGKAVNTLVRELLS